jgi:DNA-binding winged helix-turn-helix (wHTH) protein/predicted ATPase
MGNEKRIVFDPFCLDLGNEQLCKGSEAIKLTPKAFAVLDHLVGRPGQLVTKDDLLNAVWPGTFVSDAVLKVVIRQIREALGDDSKSPRFIETAHRRGYRFIGQISESGPKRAVDQRINRHVPVSGLLRRAADSLLRVVGREKALARMRGWFEKMLGGERQIVLVTGEAGIGKTAMVDTFAWNIASDHDIRVSRGQCLEQYGTGEAYLPVLEAIGRLCRQHGEVIDVLRAHAPMWLLQMPSLVSAGERALLSRDVSGATRERMLREMGEALRTLTATQPLVLILEDLHWSDYSTLDLISYLARQRQAGKLMLIGTYRPAELVISGHPLKAVKQELMAKQQCEELPLEYLSQDEVAQYLSLTFPTNRFPDELAGLIHERTEGNALFMVNAVDYLVAEGLIAETENSWGLAVEIENVEVGVPDSIKHMIEKQLDHLEPGKQRILEVASVAGSEFSIIPVVAGLGEGHEQVEARCDELARQGQFIQDCGVQVLPDGKTVSRYGFIHALYRNVLYERLPASRRVQLHRRIGEQGETLYGDRAGEIAAELAMHFEMAADFKQAANYLQQAANNAIRRFAYHEAVALARRGLDLLSKLPETRERAEQELCLRLTLGVPLVTTEGYAAPEVGIVYLRARELCRQLGETPDLSEVLWGLWTFNMLKAELVTAREIAEELLSLTERIKDPGLEMRGHWAVEITFAHLGEFALAMEHFGKALALYDPRRHLDDGFLYALNPGVAMPCFAAWSLWFLGQPDRGLGRIQEALTLARKLSEPLSLAHALLFAATLYQLRREELKARKHAEATLAVCSEHGLVMYQAMATIIRGWTLIESGQEEAAVELIREGLAALQATNTELVRPHFLGLLAEALAATHKYEQGLAALDEALDIIDRKGERYYEAELFRLKGELLLAQSRGRSMARSVGEGEPVVDADQVVAEALDCFNRSIMIARKQQAQSIELRTVMSLARFYQSKGKPEEARALLTRIYSEFNEGFATADLQEAKAMLDELQ